MRNIGPQVQQIGRELEEAAVVSGTSWVGALRKVTIPLAMPAFASSAAVLFVLIFREFPMAVFLSTSKTKVVSMSLLNYHGSGQWSYVAVIAIACRWSRPLDSASLSSFPPDTRSSPGRWQRWR